ncbi:MAG: 4-hydroxythreonine-4-phosphate dehydrogenase PdxA [Rickettsiales bacterium]|nr:4-hydroxythreonine-4-phosphate dehydrogenase PdxA [Rickettsiales bacterium]
MKKKPIVISMGEPSGINSEILIKTWIIRKKEGLLPFFVVDDIDKIEFIIRLFNLKAKTKLIKKPDETFEVFNDFLPVYDLGDKIKFKLGFPDKKNSEFIINSLKQSFNFVKNKQASSLITLPICKKSMKQYGFNYNGQTEYMGFLSRKYITPSSNEIMILTTTKPIDSGKDLIVGLATTHIPLKDIFKNLRKEQLKQKIITFNNSLKTIWKKREPFIGILALNPHAGEGGLIGKEESEILLPVIKDLKAENFDLHGPLSGDTCFFKDNRKKYDGMFCMYHDQGLSPIKTLDFFNSVNVTGGLPILRVSPDHGPAFDIANKNLAKTSSLVACLKFIEKYS